MNDDRGDGVGEHVLCVDPPWGVADHAGGIDVLVLLHVDDLGPHDAGVLHPEHDGQRQDDVAERRAEHGGDGEGEDQLRDREEHVHDAHQNLVDAPASKTRQAADGDPDGDGDAHDDQGEAQ